MTQFGQGFGKIKELEEAYQKAQEIVPHAKNLAEDLKKKVIKVSDKYQLVTVYIDGHLEISKIDLSPQLMELKLNQINQLITQPCRAAYETSCEMLKDEFEKFIKNLVF